MGLVAPGWVKTPLLAALVLALGAADAHAVTYGFSVSPNPPNVGEETTFKMTPASASDVSVEWDLDGENGFEASGRVVTKTYAAPGPLTVRMRVTEEDGHHTTVSKSITVNAPPAVDFGFSPADPLTGQEVAFTPDVTDPEGDDVTLVWDFGDGTEPSKEATHAYSQAGSYEVVLTATDEHGAVARRTHSVSVEDDSGPAASFEYTPADPFTGDIVTFRSTSTASRGSITETDWDLDGDGEFDDAGGTEVVWAFADAGDHLVQVRVTQDDGRQGVAFGDVHVSDPPPPQSPPPPPGGTTPTDGTPTGSGPVPQPVAPVSTRPRTQRPTRIRPFPVVRIAGVVLGSGARVTILSVRAPRGSKVRVRCRGRGCPVSSVARTSATRVVRFHAFERTLRAGVTLELFVRQAGRIGKYTRFVIRAGRAPARVDRCLMPGRARPVSCR
jgi:PKD repeat protein